MSFNALGKRINSYLENKKWYLYIVPLLFGIYIFYLLLGYNPNQPSHIAIMPAMSFNFWLHEMAHILTSMLPAILTAASGSISELLLGIILIFGAFKSRSYFTVMISSLWFMLACQSTGLYMADARAQKLTLVSIGGELSGNNTVIHDWNFVFGKFNILALDQTIGMFVRGIGVLVGLSGLFFASWLIYKMFKTTRSQTHVTISNLYPDPTKGPLSSEQVPPDNNTKIGQTQ